MINLKDLLDSDSCMAVNSGFYQRLKEIDNFNTLKSILNLPGDDLYLRLGLTYSCKLKPLKMAYIEPINDDIQYVSNYIIHATEGNAFSIYMHGLQHMQYRWDIPICLLSPVIFSYYSSPDDITYEKILDNICVRKQICTL